MSRMILAIACLLTVSLAQAEERLIVVTGVAEKAMDPDLVSLTVEVWSKADTAKKAQTLAAQTYKQVKKVFDTHKIKKEDIQTSQYNLNPEYMYDNKTRQNRLVGFQVMHSLNVTLRKVDEAGNFLDALTSSKKDSETGVNVNSITWDSEKREQAETAALADAVRSAKTKADEIAKAAGVRIEGVHKISHSPTYRGPTPMAHGYALKAMAESAPTELAGGQIKIRVDVTAQYQIK